MRAWTPIGNVLGVATAALLALALLTASAGRDAATRRGMAEYRAAHPACELCGYTPSWPKPANPVHHVRPYSVGGNAAATNLITLCDRHHWLCGHGKGRYRLSNVRVRECVAAMRAAYSNNVEMTDE